MNQLTIAFIAAAAVAIATGCSSPAESDVATTSDEAALESVVGTRFTVHGEWQRSGTEQTEEGEAVVNQSEGAGRVRLVFERVPTLDEAVETLRNPTDYLFVNLDIGFQAPTILGGGYRRIRSSATCVPEFDVVTQQNTDRVFCIAGFDKWTVSSYFDASGEQLLDFKIVARETPNWQQTTVFSGN